MEPTIVQVLVATVAVGQKKCHKNDLHRIFHLSQYTVYLLQIGVPLGSKNFFMKYCFGAESVTGINPFIKCFTQLTDGNLTLPHVIHRNFIPYLGMKPV